MPHTLRRRDFLRDLGLSTAMLPFVLNLPSLSFAAAGGTQTATGGDLQSERRRSLNLLAR